MPLCLTVNPVTEAFRDLFIRRVPTIPATDFLESEF
jgi:hypothetical protein